MNTRGGIIKGLLKLIGFVTVTIIALVIWGASNTNKSRSVEFTPAKSADRPIAPATPPVPVVPRATPSDSSPTQNITSLKPAVTTSTPPAPRDRIQVASNAVDSARAKLETAQQAAAQAMDAETTRIQSTDEYKKLLVVEQKVKADLDSARASDNNVKSLSISSDYNTVRQKRFALMATAKQGRDVIASSARLNDAKAAYVITYQELTDARAEKERIEREQRNAIAEEIANRPENVAVREHRLIEGMSYEQAVEAIGKPYSITKSGDFLMATWQVGESHFWSATFSSGKITVVTHSLF